MTTRRVGYLAVCALLLVLTLGLAWVLRHRSADAVILLLLLQVMIVGLAVPFLTAPADATFRSRGGAWIKAVFGAALVLPAIVAIYGRALPVRLLAADAVLVGFSVLLCGLATAMRRCGAGPALVQVLTTLLAAVMIAGVFCGNAAVEASGPSRPLVIDVLLGANPFLSMCGAIGLDLLHTDWLYEHSVISYYPYAYPSWTSAAGGMAGVGLVLFGIGSLPARQRKELP